jgi:hypothetical protein
VNNTLDEEELQIADLRDRLNEHRQGYGCKPLTADVTRQFYTMLRAQGYPFGRMVEELPWLYATLFEAYPELREES